MTNIRKTNGKLRSTKHNTDTSRSSNMRHTKKTYVELTCAGMIKCSCSASDTCHKPRHHHMTRTINDYKNNKYNRIASFVIVTFKLYAIPSFEKLVFIDKQCGVIETMKMPCLD